MSLLVLSLSSFPITTFFFCLHEFPIVVWSNFEIADMEFWRGPAYTAFFEYLDSKGGFYYEVTSVFFFLPPRLFSSK